MVFTGSPWDSITLTEEKGLQRDPQSSRPLANSASRHLIQIWPCEWWLCLWMRLSGGVFFFLLSFQMGKIDNYVTESDESQIYSTHLIKYWFCWFEICLVSCMFFLVSTPIAASTSKLPSEIAHCYEALEKQNKSLMWSLACFYGGDVIKGLSWIMDVWLKRPVGYFQILFVQLQKRFKIKLAKSPTPNTKRHYFTWHEWFQPRGQILFCREILTVCNVVRQQESMNEQNDLIHVNNAALSA